MGHYARVVLPSLIATFVLAVSVQAWTPPDYEAVPSVTHTAVAVATTTTQVVAQKGNRTLLILENISDTNIDCKVNVAAVSSEGIRLYANGGSLMLDKKYPTAAVNCLHAGAGTKTLLVTEGVQTW